MAEDRTGGEAQGPATTVRYPVAALGLAALAGTGALVWALLRLRAGIPEGTATAETAEFLGRLAAAVAAGSLLWLAAAAVVLRRLRREVAAVESRLADRAGELDRAREQLAGVVRSRMESDQSLSRHAAELARSNQDLEMFAYVASHDLQEPLRMISNYCGLIERRYGASLDRDGREFLAFAKDGAARAQRLVQDLLAYSRVGRKPRPFAPVDLRKAMDVVTRSLEVAIREAGAVIECGALPTVTGEDLMLMQLLQNLVANAVKFRGEAPPVVRVSAEQGADGWTVSVSDNGIGIPVEEMQRLFVPFQRLQGAQRFSGTGLGLATCRKIVLHHGGRIWAESAPGQGTTFRFTIPEAPPAAAAVSWPPAQA